MFEHVCPHMSTYVRGGGRGGELKCLSHIWGSGPGPTAHPRICSFVKGVVTDSLKEPLLLHQGGSKINEALPQDRERKTAKSRHIDPSVVQS